MKSKYRHIFFDLDRTLWDFDRNSRETLEEVYMELQLEQHGVRTDKFVKAYRKVNKGMWARYSKNRVNKEDMREFRFVETLQQLGINDPLLAEQISNYYLSHCPLKKNLRPYVKETLSYLSESYRLHIITNGFSDSQHIKLKTTDIGKYFDHLIISEEIGHKKPSRKIFEHAVKQVDGTMETCIMVGDDLRVDIGGAAGAGMDQVYYNPERKLHRKKTTFQVGCLSELREFL